MCGILTLLDLQSDPAALRQRALDHVKRLRHRGPDWSGIYSDESAILAHERLAIVDVEHGAQPLVDSRTGAVLAVNGEIYNHRELRASLQREHDFQTSSDCEVILYLYDELGPDFVEKLNGIFAFVLYDPARETYLVARDPIGVVPLYIGWDAEGTFYAASEMKALVDVCPRLEDFPPGHVYLGREKQMRRTYRPRWTGNGELPTTPAEPAAIRASLTAAVRRQLMSDVPFGLLVSGGVDSSIIAAIAAQFKDRRVETDGQTAAWWPQLHSFCIGLDGAPDAAAARTVAEHIGTVHHDLRFTLQEGLDALSDVIYHLETFDVTTVRASTPMYLMARKIKAMGIKMVLSGEGADEIFGGYLYFHKAPSARDFHEETVRKLQALHQFDCLRANKSMAAWGVEARVPFLDRDFLDVAMTVDPAAKMCGNGKMEKHLLREAFTGALPDEVLWRQKEQFSDGVGYSWIDTLKEVAEDEVSDAMMAAAAARFPEKTPATKEAYRYRAIFESHFPGPAALACVPVGESIACSSPVAVAWDEAFRAGADPSGRAVRGVHLDGYGA